MSLFPLRLIPHTTNFNFMRVRWVSIGIAALLVIAAIVLWNVAQRAMTAEAPPPHTAPRMSAPSAKRTCAGASHGSSWCPTRDWCA